MNNNNNNNNLLSKKKFAESMEFLNAYYVHFKLDLDNEMVIKVWYDTLKSFDDYTLERVVSDYSKNNVYPPSSPASLMEWFNKMYANHVELLKTELIKVLRLSDYRTIENDEAIYKTDYDKALSLTDNPMIKHLIDARRKGELSSPYLLEEYLKKKTVQSLDYKNIKEIEEIKGIEWGKNTKF